MTEEAAAAGVQGMFSAEVAKLNEVRQGLAKKIQQSATDGQLPASVAQTSGIMFQYFDTAYLWMTQVEQFIHMNSPENVERVANEKIASGDVTVVDGGAK